MEAFALQVNAYVCCRLGRRRCRHPRRRNLYGYEGSGDISSRRKIRFTRVLAKPLVLLNPTPQQIGVKPVILGDRGHRNAALLAVRYQFGLKFGAVQTPSATPADFRKCIRVHLSTEMLLDTYALPTALSLQGEFTGRIRMTPQA